MQKRNTTGCIGSASVPLEDAPDAREDANEFLCEACGRRPRERKRRGDGSWYRYNKCRACRRTTAGGKSMSAETRIGDGRFLYLIEILQEHVLRLKATNWDGAPKKSVVHRLKSLIAVVKQ